MVWPVDDDSHEPITPSGQLFLQKERSSVIHFALGMKHPIDVEQLKIAINDSVMVKHPRFCSLLVRDDGQGGEHWERTTIEIDRHIVVVDSPVASKSNACMTDDHESAVNGYLADMSLSSELDETKPLWEIHVLKPHKCMVLRVHHALGDGVSIMSMILALCKPDCLPNVSSPVLSSTWFQRVAKWVQKYWLSIFVDLGLLLWSLLVGDKKNPISGGDGVELWPRKLVTARFQLDDMKLVKRVIPDATINDVLIGVISAGLCGYIDHKCPNLMQSGIQMTGLAAVNLRKQPGLLELATLMSKDPSLRWGNLVGTVLLPLKYHRRTWTNPLDHITMAKSILDRKKISSEAELSYSTINFVQSWFGKKFPVNVMKRLLCNTTFTVSNMVGPQEEIAYLGNPITYVRANISSLPHSLTMHMVSYAGNADLQILVAKDIISDPEFLAECFEGALRDIKAAVLCSNLKEE